MKNILNKKFIFAIAIFIFIFVAIHFLSDSMLKKHEVTTSINTPDSQLVNAERYIISETQELYIYEDTAVSSYSGYNQNLAKIFEK